MFGRNYDTHNNAVTVEFFGIPGVGKSTVANRVAKLLREKGTPVSDLMYTSAHQLSRLQRVAVKVRFVVKEACNHPGYVLRSAIVIARTKQESVTDLIKVLFNWFFVSSVLRGGRQVSIVELLDEGIFQAYWSIALCAPDGIPNVIEHLGDSVPLPTVIVVLEADLGTIRSRLESRERHDSRVELSSRVNKGLLERADVIHRRITDSLQVTCERRKDMHLIALRNDQGEDLETAAGRIADEVQRVYVSRQHPKNV